MEKPKKKSKFLRKLIIFILILAIIVLALGYSFPGLIWVRSLGINYMQGDYESIMNKLNYTKDVAPLEGSRDDYNYVYGETTSVQQELTSEELTAFFNENRPSYYPLKNVQIQINEDGTIEAVCTANVDYFLNDVLGGEYSREEIKNHMPALGILPSNVNLYLNFSGEIIDNRASISINIVEIQGIRIPDNTIKSSEALSLVTNGINGMISKYSTDSGAYFENIKVENGKIFLKGELPSSLRREKR